MCNKSTSDASHPKLYRPIVCENYKNTYVKVVIPLCE